ncbi:uncharacterized protein LOC27207466 [Drosophila simulans]|uniref:uncharacterized protein LOC27207466 n=1 Tax=Drosophila simulans TaxID=7240 RepID=UPI00078AF058|nr:uncharacterized protein LOC27207466 [Drosophila simulans]KMZ10507.1 uncharacterized protein Dsimw501_GD27617 [Drosophila simulans]
MSQNLKVGDPVPIYRLKKQTSNLKQRQLCDISKVPLFSQLQNVKISARSYHVGEDSTMNGSFEETNKENCHASWLQKCPQKPAHESVHKSSFIGGHQEPKEKSSTNLNQGRETVVGSQYSWLKHDANQQQWRYNFNCTMTYTKEPVLPENPLGSIPTTCQHPKDGDDSLNQLEPLDLSCGKRNSARDQCGIDGTNTHEKETPNRAIFLDHQYALPATQEPMEELPAIVRSPSQERLLAIEAICAQLMSNDVTTAVGVICDGVTFEDVFQVLGIKTEPPEDPESSPEDVFKVVGIKTEPPEDPEPSPEFDMLDNEKATQQPPENTAFQNTPPSVGGQNNENHDIQDQLHATFPPAGYIFSSEEMATIMNDIDPTDEMDDRIFDYLNQKWGPPTEQQGNDLTSLGIDNKYAVSLHEACPLPTFKKIVKNVIKDEVKQIIETKKVVDEVVKKNIKREIDEVVKEKTKKEIQEEIEAEIQKMDEEMSEEEESYDGSEEIETDDDYISV